MSIPIDQVATARSTDTSPSNARLDFLVLGAGWLWQFLLPELSKRCMTVAATTTSGRESTLKFVYDGVPPSRTSPSSSLLSSSTDERSVDTSKSTSTETTLQNLPSADVVLITFPVKSAASLHHLVNSYEALHPGLKPKWILLGSTGIYPASVKGEKFTWFDENTDVPSLLATSGTVNERFEAEQALITNFNGCVLNLSGLYGERERDTKIWERAVPNEEELLGGKKSVHFVDGRDVARVILAVATKFERVSNKRWIVTDGRVYDWWELVWDASHGLDKRAERGLLKGPNKIQDDLTISPAAETSIYRIWVQSLMRKQQVKALPRPAEMLGRALDGRAIWAALGITPLGKKFAWVDEKDENDDEKA
jgi:nucleoside-diphosphate-sugar epimerase